MANVEEVRKIVVEFLKRTLNATDVKVTKVAKASDGWVTDAEVYEESSFIKSLGLPTRVQDKNSYTVRLNNSLNIESYEKTDEHQPIETE
jgi:hypothetical protein